MNGTRARAPLASLKVNPTHYRCHYYMQKRWSSPRLCRTLKPPFTFSHFLTNLFFHGHQSVGAFTILPFNSLMMWPLVYFTCMWSARRLLYNAFTLYSDCYVPQITTTYLFDFRYSLTDDDGGGPRERALLRVIWGIKNKV